jgi:hypothetical protein
MQEKCYAVLRESFRALTPEQLENFRHHLRNETPVLCGAASRRWYDPDSGAG